MKQTKPVDYLTVIEQLRQEEQTEKHQIHAPEFIPARSEEPVDYLAASKAWDKGQTGKYVIYTDEHEDESML